MSCAAHRMAAGRRVGRRAQRGVSLVEAIVAMAVMAFGMMAIVGLQTTLRANSDVAKQRSEAVRIAEEAIETARAFSLMAGYNRHRRTWWSIPCRSIKPPPMRSTN